MKKIKKTSKGTKTGLYTNKLDGKLWSVRSIVKEQMEARGVTMYMIAKATGVSNQTIGNFVRRGRPIQSDKLEKILAVLGLEIREKTR